MEKELASLREPERGIVEESAESLKTMVLQQCIAAYDKGEANGMASMIAFAERLSGTVSVAEMLAFARNSTSNEDALNAALARMRA